MTFTAGFCSLRYLPTPEIVPPVPTPATKCVTLPSVSRQISGTGRLVVGERPHRVRVLVGLERAGDLPRQPVAGLVVGVRALGRHVRRADHDLGAVRLQRVDLVFADLVGADEDAAVAALLGDEREPDAGVAAGRLDDRAAGLELALGLGGVDDPGCDAVLAGPARIQVLDLREHRGGDPVGHRVQLDERAYRPPGRARSPRISWCRAYRRATPGGYGCVSPPGDPAPAACATIASTCASGFTGPEKSNAAVRRSWPETGGPGNAGRGVRGRAT